MNKYIPIFLILLICSCSSTNTFEQVAIELQKTDWSSSCCGTGKRWVNTLNPNSSESHEPALSECIITLNTEFKLSKISKTTASAALSNKYWKIEFQEIVVT
jgi:hypothetical protein